MFRTADSCSPVKSGVSQGTIFGPSLILLIYLNNLPDATLLSIKLFAAGEAVMYKKIETGDQHTLRPPFTRYRVVLLAGRFARWQLAKTKSRDSLDVYSLRNRNNHRKIVSAHVDSKVN